MGTNVAEQAGREVKNHPAFDLLVRGGLVAYGAVYLILGWLAFQLVFGDRAGPVSKSGALHQLAQESWGELVLWAVCVGFAALVVWQLLEAWLGHRDKDGGKRLLARAQSVLRVGLYGLLSFSAAKTANGDSGGRSTDSYTAELMSTTAGPWLMAAVGLAILGYAIASVVKGVTDRYREHLDLDGQTGWSGTATKVLGRVGYVSRGAAFGVVGCLFLWAAWTHKPKESGGLDAALNRVLHAPLGPALLSVVATGFVCYGLFNLFRARYHSG